MHTNTIIDALVARRSCRAYTDEAVAPEAIDAIVHAGLYAANGRGAQAALFVVVTNRTTRDTLSKLNASILGTNTDPFYGAPLVIAVLANTAVPTYREDGSLALGNLMLAASSLNLGSCWIHRAREVFSLPEGKQLLADWRVPDGYEGIGFCILGHAAQTGTAAPRKSGRVITIA
ncbi:MAG: nitroreductase family protein [Treponema sp.]|nr:nitroreductase family protein [Treponema sp.]